MRLIPLVFAATRLLTTPLRASESLDEWLLRFEAAAASPDTVQPGGLRAIRSLAQLAGFRTAPCTHIFAVADHHPPFLEGATVLTSGGREPCTDTAVVVMLATFYTRLSPGRLSALRDAITSRLGLAPQTIDDNPTQTLHWQVTPERGVEVMIFPGKTSERDVGLSLAQSPSRPPPQSEGRAVP